MKKKNPIKETFTTLDQLTDETLGKKGTPKRDKFDRESRKETKKDLQAVIDGKETLIDADIITREDLQGYSYEEMLDKAYGKKGTPTRISAEERIKERAKNLLSDINKKEAKEEKVLSKIGKKLKGRKSLGEVFADRAKEKKELSNQLEKINIDKGWIDKHINGNKNGKPKKSTKSIKSAKVLVKRKPKKATASKIRKGKKNPIRQKNSKKRKGIK